MKNILFAASEHGSFNMVYPVLKACVGKYGIGYIGIRPISGVGLMFQKVTGHTARLPNTQLKDFDIFVTGSTARLGTEYMIWQQAADMRKKSICILDQHKQVRERFVRQGKRVLPDTICVMNNGARNALLKFGVDKKKVRVTGSPYLAEILRYKSSLSDRQKLRRRLLLRDKKVITFCTEYIVKAGQKDKHGYDEYMLLDDIIRQLNRFGSYCFRLYIKLHPNDVKALYKKYDNKTFGNIEVKVIESDPEYKLLQISDVVIGMDSIILVVSAMLGLSTISYQSVSNKKNAFIYNEVIKKNLVMSKKGFRRRLDDILAGKRRQITMMNDRALNPIRKIMRVIKKAEDV